MQVDLNLYSGIDSLIVHVAGVQLVVNSVNGVHLAIVADVPPIRAAIRIQHAEVIIEGRFSWSMKMTWVMGLLPPAGVTVTVVFADAPPPDPLASAV